MKRVILLCVLLSGTPVVRAHDGAAAHNKADAAIKKLNEVLADEPDDLKALQERGYLYLMHVDEYESALTDFDKLVRLKPAHEPGRVCRGMARHRLGDLRGALADLGPICDGGTRNAGAWFARAEVRLDLGDATGARDDLDRALAIRKWPLALVRRAHVRAHLGELDKALQDYGAALESDPRHIEALLGRAQLHARRDDPAAAAKDLEVAAEANAQDPRVHAARARIALRRGFKLESMPAVRKALELWRAEVQTARSPHRKAHFLLEMARLRGEAGEPWLAIELLDEALGLAPDRVDLLGLKLRILEGADAKPEQREAARRRLLDAAAARLPEGVAAIATPVR